MTFHSNLSIVLASTSETRRQILHNAGIAFSAIAPGISEESAKEELVNVPATQIALELAKRKARSISSDHGNALVIGCDQTLHIGSIRLDKAQSVEEAHRHLMILQGKTHILRTAAVCSHNDQIIWSHIAKAHMKMREMSKESVDSYLRRAGPSILFSVGCYQIEGLGAQLFEAVEGDHFSILGLPLYPLLEFLRQSGILET